MHGGPVSEGRRPRAAAGARRECPTGPTRRAAPVARRGAGRAGLSGARPLAKVERAVVDRYANVALPENHRTALERIAGQAATDSQESIKTVQAALRRQLTDLDAQEDRLLDLFGDPDWPQDKLKTRVRDVRDARQRVARRLADTSDDLEAGHAVLTAALELLANPRDLYDTATDEAPASTSTPSAASPTPPPRPSPSP